AGLGADELFDFVGDAYARGRKWLHSDLPLPRPAWGVPVPHFAHLSYLIGEPVTAEVHPGEDEDHAVRRIRREGRGALEEVIDEALAERHAHRGNGVEARS